MPSTPFIDGEQDTGHDQRQHRRRTVDVGYTDAIAADLCEYSPAGTWPRWNSFGVENWLASFPVGCRARLMASTIISDEPLSNLDAKPRAEMRTDRSSSTTYVARKTGAVKE